MFCKPEYVTRNDKMNRCYKCRPSRCEEAKTALGTPPFSARLSEIFVAENRKDAIADDDGVAQHVSFVRFFAGAV